MSKSISNHYQGTAGFRAFYGREISEFIESQKDAESIIAERVKGLDTNEHRIKYKKILSPKKMTEVRKKIKQRTATIEEYRNYMMTLRINRNRQQAIDNFWVDEKTRLSFNLPPTRAWTNEQKEQILADIRPRLNGKPLQGHHTYSVKKYPHLAGRSEVIYPVTFYEHLYEWHGGNFKNSLPGKPINKK